MTSKTSKYTTYYEVSYVAEGAKTYPGGEMDVSLARFRSEAEATQFASGRTTQAWVSAGVIVRVPATVATRRGDRRVVARLWSRS